MIKNVTEKDHLLNLNLDTYVIDSDTLCEFKNTAIVVWLTKNMKEIRKHTAEHLLEIYRNTQPCAEIPFHYFNYCSEDYDLAIENLTGTNCRLKRPLAAVAAFAARYNEVTCDQLLFRQDKPIRISQKAEGFLRYMKEIPPHKRSRIAAVLMSSQVTAPKLEDVLLDRLQELAAERGELLQSVAWVSDYTVPSRRMIRAFLNEDRTDPELDFLKDGHLLTMVYYICIQYGVSADRLLLQDYSRYAVMSDGTPLSEEEKRYLSLFLRATKLVQDIAIQDTVIAAITGPKSKSFS